VELKCKRCGKIGTTGKPINHLGYCSRRCRGLDTVDANIKATGGKRHKRDIGDELLRQGWTGRGVPFDI
jgi:endogenous inhibitor of DNA gyrase (YacG/DUF329 family)